MCRCAHLTIAVPANGPAPYRQPSKGRITDLVIDSTGLKVFGEGEWKGRKHGAEKRRV